MTQGGAAATEHRKISRKGAKGQSSEKSESTRLRISFLFFRA